MKGAVAVSLPPAKRRWRPAAIVVLALVLFSLLVPLAFIFGLNNRFPSGYLTDDQASSEISFRNYGPVDVVSSDLKKNEESRIDNLLRRFTADFPKVEKHKSGEILDKESDNKVTRSSGQPSTNIFPNHQQEDAKSHHKQELLSRSKGDAHQLDSLEPLATNDDSHGKQDILKGSPSEESGKSCELQFGSYCLWSIEHREDMIDSTVKRLKDQLFLARAYYPSIAKLRGQEAFSRELKQNIQEHERMLSETIVDADLPPVVGKKIQKMDQTIAQAKSSTVDCNNIDRKLRQILDLTEDEANFHMKQSAFLYNLGVQTMPKTLHCLSMRLTVEYFRSPQKDLKHLDHTKVNNPNFFHYVIFSTNTLATSVAINSTVMNSQVTGDMVFHVVTSAENYYAMELWFTRNSYKEATIHVINFEELNLKGFHESKLEQLSLSEEFRISIRGKNRQALQLRTEYISVFSHSHFLLPEIFKYLKRVIILDDDVVIQRDLSSLWSLDLEGKVNGAAEYCGVKLGDLQNSFGRNEYDASSCAWMSGVNIIDLEKWKEHNITERYLELFRSFQTKSKSSWRISALPASLLAFKDLIYPLDDSWTVSGLGHNYGISRNVIKSSGILHYNGNMKPWLDLGIRKYKRYWRKFLTHDEQFMNDCNVNP